LTNNTHNFSDAAGRYALSLFEISKEKNILKEIELNIKFIDQALNKSEDFKKFVANPTINKNNRLNVIEELGKKNNFNIFFINFLKILIEKHRFFFLEKIIKYFNDILCDFRGELNATVSMPSKMSEVQIKEIESMLNKVLKKKVNLDFKHDLSLISGAKLQIGSLMIDDTVKSKFNKILNNL
jgi:F-type H+-transporting ATPase subunit delta